MAYPLNESAAFTQSKEDILNLMRTKKCADVAFVSDGANSFDDLIPLLFTFAKSFDCDVAYLMAILALINDDVLISRGVYVGKVLASLENPYWIVNSTVTNVILKGQTGVNYREGLEIHNDSIIDKITVQDNVRIGQISIVSGSQVAELEILDGCCVELLHVKACNAKIGTLSKVIEGSCVENIGIDETAVFGGTFCKPQDLT